MDRETLDDLRAKESAATKGPWGWNGRRLEGPPRTGRHYSLPDAQKTENPPVLVVESTSSPEELSDPKYLPSYHEMRHSMLLIPAMRNALPELLVYVAELEATVAEIKEGVPDYWQDIIGDRSYKPTSINRESASHHTTVKRVLAEVAGTEAADVIASLVHRVALHHEWQKVMVGHFEERETELRDERDALSAAADELLLLKDDLKHSNPQEYERRKEPAWDALRKARGR